ncbi:MAG TPA: hypothetical protein VFN42_01590 [Acetobacteraceae bacterium]|nr:hypothetical protein [Acetobacteraceae bacterium]
MSAKFIFYVGTGLLAITGSAVATQTPAAATRAVPVDAFLDSLGVDTHISQGYNYTNYIPALRYLGLRAIRDSTKRPDGLLAVHRATGVRADIGNAGDLPELLRVGHILAAAGALLSFEGANEPNNFPITYHGKRGGSFKSWVAVAEFQRDLYASVKRDPVLRSYPVFHVSEGGAEADNVGMQWLTIPDGAGTVMPAGTKYADYANPHNYVIGNCGRYLDNDSWQAADPVLNKCWDGLYGEYGRTWAKRFPGYSDAALQTLPRVTTETGWDSVSDPGGETVQGKVLTNTYLAQYARGWTYTFIYELGDGEGSSGHQGLFHADWTPKLAATYIHNLTTILATAQATPAAAAMGEAANTLAYTIPDKPATVHDLLMQKPDGSFALAVWGEQVTGVNDVTLALGSRHAQVRVYDITSGTAPVRTLADVDRVPLTLSDHALIVEITP